MLKYLRSSLFESPALAIVNTVNIVGVMGKGIAKDFKRLYPEMYLEYRDKCLGGDLGIGELHIFSTSNKIIINFPTKKHWRAKSKIEYITAGLVTLSQSYMKYGITSISFPQLGTGNGELDWRNEVQPIMEEYLAVLPIPVYIHLYPAAADFVPERLDIRAAKQYRQELLQERERLSPVDVWEDIKHVVAAKYQPELFDDIALTYKNIYGKDNLVFNFKEGEAYTLFMDEFTKFWNILRAQGALTINEFPDSSIDGHIIEHFFNLLLDLDYIKEVQISTAQASIPNRGLMLLPRPESRQEHLINV